MYSREEILTALALPDPREAEQAERLLEETAAAANHPQAEDKRIKKLLMKVKTQLRFRNLMVTLMVICITPLCERGRMLNGASSENALAGKEIVCAIDLCDDMYGGHGLETGFSYQMLNKFAHDNGCEIKIVAARKDENWLDSLRHAKADIVVAHSHDTSEFEGVTISRNVDEETVWAVADAANLKQVNSWISHMISSHEFEQIKHTYLSCKYDPIKRADKGITSKRLSPYDDVIRKYAAELGWDWRMLAAVIYQESKFSINSRSHRGAQGLMQVMPQTAKHYKVEDLLDPDQAYLNYLCLGKIYDLPNGWNKEPMPVPCQGEKSIVHYALYKKPWQYDDVIDGEYFWQYAEQSPFYGEIRRRRERFGEAERLAKEATAVEILEHALRIVESDVTFAKILCKK